MGSRMAKAALTGVAFVALLATASAANAATYKFRANLTCSGEVPPNNCGGMGTVTATLQTPADHLTWTGHYKWLTGKVIGAHFHGPVSWVGNTTEQNAPIQIGTKGSLRSPFHGSATISKKQAEDLIAGRYYFNIHTPEHPAGEIRGQVIRTQ
jgi:hypothetical protein